jgi:rhamnulokinase
MPDSAAEKPFLAFDFGAESGRAVLGYLHSGVLNIREIHRFPNEPVKCAGSLRWDVLQLWLEVQKALASVEEEGLSSIGVDSWGVDYALLGEKGELLENPYHYRDRRTEGVMEEVFRLVLREEIYAATGIQFMPINTLYQLIAAKRQTPALLKSARHLIMISDLFNYWLTGSVVCEYTNATTTQLVNPVSRDWARELIERLELPPAVLAPIVEPGFKVGTLRSGIARSTSLSATPVIAPATHDTGSAIAAISAREGTAFLSSGTWSLLGTEVDAPVASAEALRLNFTNEGGVCGTTRLLKNVMGLWILQGCRRSWTGHGKSVEYPELMELAGNEPAFKHLVDPDDRLFLRPADMAAAMDQFCARTHQPSPASPGRYVRAVLESLAFKYRLVVRDLEQVSRRPITQIRVIGGGSRNRLLNQFTADATGRRVFAGPAEATAIGNLAIQILATGGASSLAEVRSIVDRSFATEVFEPGETDKWDGEEERFQQYCEMAYA